MKTSKQIEQQISTLQQQLSKIKQREREQRLARLLSTLDKSGLSDDEAIAAIEAAAGSKRGGV